MGEVKHNIVCPRCDKRWQDLMESCECGCRITHFQFKSQFEALILTYKVDEYIVYLDVHHKRTVIELDSQEIIKLPGIHPHVTKQKINLYLTFS